VSVALSSDGSGSVVLPPPIVTVLLSDVVAVGSTVAVSVNVAVPPTARSTTALMSPLPPAGHVDPALAAQVQVAPVSDAGRRSWTTAPTEADGPALVATIVYVTGVPGTDVAAPSVFVTDRSAVGTSVSVSVAESLPATGSVTPTGAVTVAVLTRLPVASGSTSAVSVYVADEPAGRSTTSAMSPVPAGAHVAPAAPVHVHVTFDRMAGTTSSTDAPETSDGPALATTIVYVTGVPGTAVGEPSDLVTDRSAVGTRVSTSVAVLSSGVSSVIPVGGATVTVFSS
jgi:hypothetical protein